ncbi:MAG: toll/interleukin-1 receptor domain-containing protein [Piscinibacter sp.]|nr:toll/interleukin-1 receptor domain-containing protein [Piscinibacter sp.]
MKIFISWSGDASKAAALALRQAIGDVFAGVEPWMSAEDIKPGQQWFGELMETLQETRFAIACLTRGNLSAPWVMFEAGAVSCHFGELKLAPLLLEGDVKELTDPMARFNGTRFDRAGVQALFESINESLGSPLKKKVLEAALGTVWPDLEKAVGAALRLDRPPVDVFLSVPMAAFDSDAQYQPFRAEAMKVVRALREQAGLTVFCALEKIESLAQFDTYGDGAREDIEMLGRSANFVMLYPQKLPTSALFEAGYALARGLPCRFFVRDQGQDAFRLPFLMRKLPEVFTHVSIIDDSEWKTYDDIAARLVKNAPAWFGKRLRARFEG